jgi:hypothetical protein
MWEEDFGDCVGERRLYTIRKSLLGKDGLHDVTYTNSDVIFSEKKKMRWTQYILSSYVEKNRKRVYSSE